MAKTYLEDFERRHVDEIQHALTHLKNKMTEAKANGLRLSGKMLSYPFSLKLYVTNKDGGITVVLD